MKQKSEELLVINRRVFFLILMAIALAGIIIGYTIGYITTPAKEIHIQKTNDSEKTVLPTTVETAHAKKQENSSQPVETKQEKSPQPNAEEQQKIEQKKEIAKKEEDKKTQEIEKQRHIQKEEKEKIKTAKKTIRSVKYTKGFLYTVQAGAFSDIENAKILKDKISQSGYMVFLVSEELYKVRVGKYGSFSQAKKISQELDSKGFSNFIVKIKTNTKGGKP